MAKRLCTDGKVPGSCAGKTARAVQIRLSANFSRETLKARRDRKELFQVMKGKDLHPKSLYPAKLSFRMERQIKCFPVKVKLQESSSPSPYYLKY